MNPGRRHKFKDQQKSNDINAISLEETCRLGKIRGEEIVLEHSTRWPFGFIISYKTLNVLIF